MEINRATATQIPRDTQREIAKDLTDLQGPGEFIHGLLDYIEKLETAILPFARASADLDANRRAIETAIPSQNHRLLPFDAARYIANGRLCYADYAQANEILALWAGMRA